MHVISCARYPWPSPAASSSDSGSSSACDAADSATRLEGDVPVRRRAGVGELFRPSWRVDGLMRLVVSGRRAASVLADARASLYGLFLRHGREILDLLRRRTRSAACSPLLSLAHFARRHRGDVNERACGALPWRRVDCARAPRAVSAAAQSGRAKAYCLAATFGLAETLSRRNMVRSLSNPAAGARALLCRRNQ